MNSENQITYKIKKGDNLYQIAKEFNTDVQVLLQENAPLNPFTLQIGQDIIVSPGKTYEEFLDEDEDETIIDAQDMRNCSCSYGGYFQQGFSVPVSNPSFFSGNMPQQMPMQMPFGTQNPFMPGGTEVVNQPMITQNFGQPFVPQVSNPSMMQQGQSQQFIPQSYSQPLVPQSNYVQPTYQQAAPASQTGNTFAQNPLVQVNTFVDEVPQTFQRANNVGMISNNSLENEMRQLWFEHILWTRNVIMSIMDNNGDLTFVTSRLLKNPRDIGNLYSLYYSEQVSDEIARLFTEHLSIADQLVKALKASDNVKANELNKKWYQNADDIASFFASFNPYYDENEVRKMMHQHLAYVTKEALARLNENYAMDVANFDDMEDQVMKMADYFTQGIIMDKQM